MFHLPTLQEAIEIIKSGLFTKSDFHPNGAIHYECPSEKDRWKICFGFLPDDGAYYVFGVIQ
jgi:hypothetical protein